MKVCVIGAGVAGLACCVTLKQQHIDFECYEKDSETGGIWNYKETADSTSVYKNCTLNHANDVMKYPFRKEPIEGHHFAHRSQYFKYLKKTFVEFHLSEHVRLNSDVESVVEIADDKWAVKVSGQSEKIFTHVIVCAGFYSKGYVPEKYLTEYKGKYIHSSNYRTPSEYENQRVLVVGSGSSAIQIACDLANVTDQVSISVREMPYVVPKFVMGKPYSALYSSVIKRLPRNMQSIYLETMINFFNGKQEKYGVPAPVNRLLDGRLPISQDLFDKTANGMVRFLPSIKQMRGNETIFDDGSIHTFDHIIFSTGYKVGLPSAGWPCASGRCYSS